MCTVYSRHLLGESPLRKKPTIPLPQKVAKLCALNLSSAGTVNYKTYHGNFLLMDNKHWKLFIIEQSKWFKFRAKCTKIRLAAGIRPDPLGEFIRSPRLPSRNGGVLLTGGKEREAYL